MRGRQPVLELGDVQQPELEVDLLRPQRHQLADAQPMPVGQRDQRGVPVPVPAKTPGGRYELLDFGRREMLPGAAVAVPDAGRWRDFPVYSVWTPWADGS